MARSVPGAVVPTRAREAGFWLGVSPPYPWDLGLFTSPAQLGGLSPAVAAHVLDPVAAHVRRSIPTAEDVLERTTTALVWAKA